METKYERSQCTLAVYVFFIHDGTVFLLRRKNTRHFNGYWCPPSGHLEQDETPTQAAIRESAEEGGVCLQDLMLVHTSFRPAHDETGPRLDLFYHATAWHGELRNNEPKKCSEAGWYPLDELPGMIMPHVRHVLLSFSLGQRYSELGVAFLKKYGYYDLPILETA